MMNQSPKSFQSELEKTLLSQHPWKSLGGSLGKDKQYSIQVTDTNIAEPIEIRLCRECLFEFPLNCFRKCTGGTGYRYICKSCYNQRVRKRVVGHCTHIFKFGPNKGKVCPNNCYGKQSEKCSRHSDKTRQYQNAYISNVFSNSLWNDFGD